MGIEKDIIKVHNTQGSHIFSVMNLRSQLKIQGTNLLNT